MSRVAFAALAISLLLGTLPAWADTLAQLSSLSGDVQVLNKGQAQWHAAKDAEDLSAGDSVKTGAQASAFLQRKDGSIIELLPFAQVTIEDERGFLLTIGRLWSHFKKTVGAPYFIRTPNATALIRGTTLGVGYESERSRVVVTEGLVEVRDRDQAHLEVPAGFRLDVDRLGRLERLERAERREIDEGRGFHERRQGVEGRMPHMERPAPQKEHERHPAVRSDRTDDSRELLSMPEGAEAHERGERGKHSRERMERAVNPAERDDRQDRRERPFERTEKRERSELRERVERVEKTERGNRQERLDFRERASTREAPKDSDSHESRRESSDSRRERGEDE